MSERRPRYKIPTWHRGKKRRYKRRAVPEDEHRGQPLPFHARRRRQLAPDLREDIGLVSPTVTVSSTTVEPQLLPPPPPPPVQLLPPPPAVPKRVRIRVIPPRPPIVPPQPYEEQWDQPLPFHAERRRALAPGERPPPRVSIQPPQPERVVQGPLSLEQWLYKLVITAPALERARWLPRLRWREFDFCNEQANLPAMAMFVPIWLRLVFGRFYLNHASIRTHAPDPREVNFGQRRVTMLWTMARTSNFMEFIQTGVQRYQQYLQDRIIRYEVPTWLPPIRMVPLKLEMTETTTRDVNNITTQLEYRTNVFDRDITVQPPNITEQMMNAAGAQLPNNVFLQMPSYNLGHTMGQTRWEFLVPFIKMFITRLYYKLYNNPVAPNMMSIMGHDAKNLFLTNRISIVDHRQEGLEECLILDIKTYGIFRGRDRPLEEGVNYDRQARLGRTITWYLPWNHLVAEFDGQARSPEMWARAGWSRSWALPLLMLHEIIRNLLLHDVHPEVAQIGENAVGMTEGSDRSASATRFDLVAIRIVVRVTWSAGLTDLEAQQLNFVQFNAHDPVGEPTANNPLGLFGRFPHVGLSRAQLGKNVRRDFHTALLVPQLTIFGDPESHTDTVTHWPIDSYTNIENWLYDRTYQIRLMIFYAMDMSNFNNNSLSVTPEPTRLLTGIFPPTILPILNDAEAYFPEPPITAAGRADYLVMQHRIRMGGGCTDKPFLQRERLPHSLTRVTTYFPNVPSTNNNCLIASLYHLCKSTTVFNGWTLEGDFNTVYELIRDYCQIPRGTLIAPSDITKITSRFQLKVEVYATSSVVPDHFGDRMLVLADTYTNPDYLITAKVLLINGHYYPIADDRGLEFRRCGCCYKWMHLTPKYKHHLLNCKRCQYCGQPTIGVTSHKCRVKTTVQVGERKVLERYELPHEYTAENDIYWGDFETSTFSIGTRHLVYAASLKGGKGTKYAGEPLIFYGLDAMSKFITACTGLSGTMVFFNGSSFDFILIFYYLLRSHPLMFDNEISEVVIKDNRIMSFRFGKLKFIDLFLFLRSSLKKACADLGVPAEYRKSEFDHRKMKDFSDLARYETELKAYLRLDVEALRCCYEIFARDVWKNYSVNVNDFMTLSHMGYSIWLSTLPTDVRIYVPKTEEDVWFRRSLFGGRCGPQVPSYISSQYAAMQFNQEGAVTDDYYRSLTDYQMMLDVVSLYPWAMLHAEYPVEKFSIHELPEDQQQYSNQMKKAVKRLSDPSSTKPMFYEVDIEPPKNILTPFLQERASDGSLRYSLLPKRHQVHTGCELQEAIKLGYKIQRVHKYISFQKKANIFGAFIEKCFNIKKNAVKGSVTYLVAKLIMNSVSGKQSQKVITTQYNFYSGANDVREMVSGKSVKDVKTLYAEAKTGAAPGDLDGGDTGDPSSEIIGTLVKSVKRTPLPTKCVYLGAWILSQARIWMSQILRAVGGYHLPEHMYAYTDTDSLVVHRNTFDLMQKVGNYCGKELGQLTDDLDGGRIVRAIFLAPKSYIIEYITGTLPHRLKWKVRCKGIPHDEMPIDVQSVIDNSYVGHHDIIYECISLRADTSGVVLDRQKCITFSMFQLMLNNEARVRMELDSLKRALCDISFRRPLGIFETRLQRTMNRSHWWTTNKRYLLGNLPVPPAMTTTSSTVKDELTVRNNISVPVGHEQDMLTTLISLAEDPILDPDQLPLIPFMDLSDDDVNLEEPTLSIENR